MERHNDPMQKHMLHARVTRAIKVTERELDDIIGFLVTGYMIPSTVDTLARFSEGWEPHQYDDAGYIPSTWFWDDVKGKLSSTIKNRLHTVALKHVGDIDIPGPSHECQPTADDADEPTPYTLHARVTRGIEVSEEELSAMLDYVLTGSESPEFHNVLDRFTEGTGMDSAGLEHEGYIPLEWLLADLRKNLESEKANRMMRALNNRYSGDGVLSDDIVLPIPDDAIQHNADDIEI